MLRLVAKPVVRAWSGGLFVLAAGGVVFPLAFIKGTHLNHGTTPYFIAVLGTSGLIFLGSALAASVTPPALAFKLEKAVINQVAEGAVIQPAVEAQNDENISVVMNDWRAHLAVGSHTHQLRREVGQSQLAGGLDLPFLDRIGPLPPGPTIAHLRFVVVGVTQEQLVEAIGAGPAVLTLEVRSGKHWSQASLDLSQAPKETRAVPAS